MLFGVLIFIQSIGLSGQSIDVYFQDIQWAHYNANINIFLSDGIGSAIKGGIDPGYVDSKIGISDYAFHNINGMLIEAISVVDFNRAANENHYVLKFANGQSATFPEVIMYLADNYANYFSGPDLTRPFLPEEMVKIKDSCKLKESKRVVLQEYWYYDIRDNKMKPYIRGMGIIDNVEKSNTPVVWVDMRYFEANVLKRINVTEENGESQNLIEYMINRPFVMEDIKWGYSRYFDQTQYDAYNNEVDVYFDLLSLNNQFVLEHASIKVKKGKPLKTKELKGLLVDGELSGKWTLNYSNGKPRAEFLFENGIAQGEYKLYTISGELKEKGKLSKGKKDGEITAYFPGGSKKSVKRYKNGVLNGKQELYYTNGSVHSKFSYLNGFVEGAFVSYNPDGSSKLKGTFKKGVIVEDWYYNIEIDDLMCGYLNDELPHLGEVEGIESNCMEDCTATFHYRFNAKEDINCFNGICIIPERMGNIK
ncbi:MAG: hypothetical protein CL840_20220 [Crocinitomicaceae bacterium]|nr:hypothetical protein [Crocinitomicaceae bacterium]